MQHVLMCKAQPLQHRPQHSRPANPQPPYLLFLASLLLHRMQGTRRVLMRKAQVSDFTQGIYNPMAMSSRGRYVLVSNLAPTSTSGGRVGWRAGQLGGRWLYVLASTPGPCQPRLPCSATCV